MVASPSIPFLKNFYRNPSQSALATQLFFLFQRMQQIQDLKQRSLFENVRVADFLIEKDRLFAEVTLSNEEMGLYDKVYEHITLDAPTPDLVIYLQAPIEILKERNLASDSRKTAKRGISRFRRHVVTQTRR